MTRAIILVGGEGTRLRPLTYTRPKPLLPIAGTSILERKLAHLAEHGIVEATLSLGYRPDAFLEAFPSGRAAGIQLHYAVEPSPLDTAGAIRFAATEVGWIGHSEPLVVVNGDLLTELDISAQVAFHSTTGAEATLALTQVEDPSAFGVVPTDAAGRVTSFVEKPPKDEAPTDWINAGIYVLNPSVLERIPAHRKVSIEREVFPAIAAEGRLYAVRSPAYWIDAGTPALFVRANTDWLDRHNDTRSLVANARIDATATIQRSVVGAGCSIGPHTTIVDSILLPGASVASGAVVRQSIVGSNATIGTGADISDHCVIGDGAHVTDRAVLRAERLA
jgi:mannose-1-phosphate guanylyltransferase